MQRIESSTIFTIQLERVKGIEPSYSAWKAAALPLSYTRVTGSLTRPGGGLNCPGGRFAASSTSRGPFLSPLDSPPLTAAAMLPILKTSETNERR